MDKLEILKKSGWSKFINLIKDKWIINRLDIEDPDYKEPEKNIKKHSFNKLYDLAEVQAPSIRFSTRRTVSNGDRPSLYHKYEKKQEKPLIHYEVALESLIRKDYNMIIDKKTNEYKIIKAKNLYFSPYKRDNDLYNFMDLCFVKIKGYQLSSDLFGFIPSKKKMYKELIKIEKTSDFENILPDEQWNELEGFDKSDGYQISNFGRITNINEEYFTRKLYKIQDIMLEYACKDSIIRDIVVLLNEETGKNLKFVLEDLEFVIPDIEMLEKVHKGYTPPLDRTLKVGKKVKISKKNNYNIPQGTKGVVTAISKPELGNRYLGPTNNERGNKYCRVKIKDKEYNLQDNKLKVIA